MRAAAVRPAQRGDRLLVLWQATGARQAVVRLPALAQPVSVEYAVDRRQAADLQKARATGIAVGADPVAVWWRIASSIERANP